MAELVVSNIKKSYLENSVIENASFEINVGECVGLIGPNGCGKTTLFKIINGIERADSGTVSFSRGRTVGYLEQIPDYNNSILGKEVLEEAFKEIYRLELEIEKLSICLAKSPEDRTLLGRLGSVQNRYEALGGYEIKTRIKKIVEGLKITDEMLNVEFEKLSGGEKTRICLGKLLLQETDILFLDEPTNHLDLTSLIWLEDFIENYNGTVLIISHDRYFLDKVATKIISFENGDAKVYSGNYSYYVEKYEEYREQYLRTYENQQREIKRLEKAAERLHIWANSRESAKMHKAAFNIEKRIERIDKLDRLHEDKVAKIDFTKSKFVGNDIFTVSNLSKSFGDRKVLDNVDFSMKKDERIAIIGDNGSGKTTFFKAITGNIDYTGDIQVGKSVKLEYLDQEVVFENENSTVLETLQAEIKVNEEKGRAILARYMFFGDEVFKTIGVLSGGERSRLRLCILSQKDINLILMDEPTNHLDIVSRESLEDALDNFDGSMMFISHDRYFIRKFANGIFAIEDGKGELFYGNYVEYEQFLKEKVKTEKEEQEEKKSGYEDYRKNKQKDPKVINRKIKKIEKEIEDLEDLLGELEEREKEILSDYVALEELQKEKEGVQFKIEELFEQWESLSKGI